MLNIIDFKTDESDDIILNGDIILEDDFIVSCKKVAERRISARYDDFQLSAVAAGIERHLYNKIDNELPILIQSDINRVMMYDDLFNKYEYKSFVTDLEDGKLQIYIKFISPVISNNYSFKVVINQENQRSYN